MLNKPINIMLILLAALLLVVCSACRQATPTETSAPTATHTVEPTATSVSQGEGEAAPEDESTEQVVVTPTPQPTATPGPIEEVVAVFADATGAADLYIFGLSVEDWINLGISALIVLIGAFIGSRLLLWILRWIVKKTATEYDEAFLTKIKTQVKWFVVVVSLQFATTRLSFLSVGVKEWLDRIYFVLYVLVLASILWGLVDFVIEKYREKIATEEITGKADVLIPVAERIAKVIIFVIGIIIVLDEFGVNVTALTAMLGIGGLALSLAAQDTLADAISGFTILLDQPFLVGHRIEISELGTWGDVVEIGTRTTRIRTRDNRLVIIPNSTIAKSQVVNYTYPDPRYRVQIDIGIGYGMDIEETRQIIIDTVRKLDFVLKDKPVDALYNEMGDSAMMFRVRWWIESYEDTRRVYDQVNTALQTALDEAGIEMPFPTQEIQLKVDEEGKEEI